ncbi:surface protein [Streptomyces nitrosporeus]|uniref:Surface protein n=1 Tax=Streptomyces nitrosporeus TaxID=28894 RepID=A0A5J6FB88_9ACTN|nr:surface protein [Streptomyces nitrosporeus]
MPGPAAPAPVPGGAPLWVPLLLAGDPDDDGSEPHICRGID